MLAEFQPKIEYCKHCHGRIFTCEDWDRPRWDMSTDCLCESWKKPKLHPTFDKILETIWRRYESGTKYLPKN